MNKFEQTWENYVELWRLTDKNEMKNRAKNVIVNDCGYRDPLIQANGTEALFNYIYEFQQQFSGGYIETYAFMSHHGRSMANWHMKSSNATIISEGISFGEYNEAGELTCMTGFFETQGNG
ncbi:MAG: nuclear transport factor 2 family protein [Rhizobiales bacterium]|nr:nuclear transport factor 2 family protein [Hyphomicrobiales bacterium]